MKSKEEIEEKLEYIERRLKEIPNDEIYLQTAATLQWVLRDL
jgi:hypothetical protein